MSLKFGFVGWTWVRICSKFDLSSFKRFDSTLSQTGLIGPSYKFRTLGFFRMIALRHFAPIFLCLAHWSFENHNCISTSKDCSMFCSIYFIKIFDYFHFEVNYTFFRYGNIHHTVDYFRLEICHLGNFGFHYKRNEIVYISDPEKIVEYPWLHSSEKNSVLLDKILHKLPYFGSFSRFFTSSIKLLT